MKLTKRKLKEIVKYVDENSRPNWQKAAAKQLRVSRQTIYNFVNGHGHGNDKITDWFVQEYEEMQEVDRLINDK